MQFFRTWVASSAATEARSPLERIVEPDERSFEPPIPLPNRICNHSLDNGECGLPFEVDLPRAQSKHVSAQPFGVQVPRAISFVSRFSVPLFAVDFQREAMFDQQVMMPHSRNPGLAFNPVTFPLQSATNDRLVSGLGATRQVERVGLQAPRSKPTDPTSILDADEAPVNRRLQCSDRVLTVQAVDRAPKRLHAASPPPRFHLESRDLPVRSQSVGVRPCPSGWDLDVEIA